MEDIISEINKLKGSGVSRVVKERMEEFKKMGSASSKEIFKELCFCILTANFSAERCMNIHAKVGDGFLFLPEKALYEKLKELGHRYPRTRARYICENRKYMNTIKDILASFKNENERREWLVKNVKGISYKEASHFLRNTGHKNIAILDFHVLDVLEKNGIVKRPKTLTKRRYLDIEEKLKEVARRLDITLAELDLYLWYMETGKVLK